MKYVYSTIIGWTKAQQCSISLAEQAKKDTRLLQYDLRSLLAVTPTVATLKALSGFRGVYKNTALGCLAAVPDHVVVPHDAMFEFIVTVQNADVFNYTALTLQPQKIYEVYYQPSPPYTFFLLNGDMELNRNGNSSFKKCSRNLNPSWKRLKSQRFLR